MSALSVLSVRIACSKRSDADGDDGDDDDDVLHLANMLRSCTEKLAEMETHPGVRGDLQLVIHVATLIAEIGLNICLRGAEAEDLID